MNAIFYYHANCMDGCGSAAVAKLWAWAEKQLVREKYFSFELVPFQNGEVLPNNWAKSEITHVYFIDCVATNEDLIAIITAPFDTRKEVIILDHHQSNIDRIKGDPLLDKYFSKGHSVLDSSRSGCGIAWDYFFPEEKQRPTFVSMIEDRDLFRFISPWSKPFYHFLGTLGFNIDKYAEVLKKEIVNSDFRDPKQPLHEEIKLGQVIGEYYDQQIERFSKNNYIGLFELGDHLIPFFNVSFEYGSDLCAKTINANNIERAGYITMEDNGFIRGGLRSRKDIQDCHTICIEMFGGGGHPNAAGFKVKLEDFWKHRCTEEKFKKRMEKISKDLVF